jgi:hypothetical protein
MEMENIRYGNGKRDWIPDQVRDDGNREMTGLMRNEGVCKLEATGKEGRAGAKFFTDEAKMKQVSCKINDLQEASPPLPPSEAKKSERGSTAPFRDPPERHEQVGITALAEMKLDPGSSPG